MKVGILGAGVAGLAVGWYLRQVADFELHEGSAAAGGLARSFAWHGFDCDLAPHRFFTTNQALLREVQALVPMRRIERKSRIRQRGRWIRDPISLVEVLAKFLPTASARVVWHYAFRPQQHEDSFEALVLNKYGRGLNDLFFKPYSEKLFGIPASEISVAWGRRKIRVSGLRDLVRRDPRLYFEHFYYPAAGGYGAIPDRLYAALQPRVRLNSRVVAIRPLASGQYECWFTGPGGGTAATYDVLVSTLPITELAALLDCRVHLRFRPLVLLYLLVGVDRVSDCHWSYFADREVIVNRVAEFKHFGSGLPAGKTVLCCEVTDDEEFSVERVVRDLRHSDLLPTNAPILDTKVIRVPRAYPVYDRSYERESAASQQAFAAHPRIHQIGRHAQFAHKDVDEILEEAKIVADAVMQQGVTPLGALAAWA